MERSSELCALQGYAVHHLSWGLGYHLLWILWNPSAELQPCPLTKPISYLVSDVCAPWVVWMVRSEISFVSQVWVPASKLSDQNKKGRWGEWGLGKQLLNFAQNHPVSGILLTTLRESILPSWRFWNQICKWVPTQLIAYNYILHNVIFYCITLYFVQS